MAKSATQKRRREAEADQERRQEENGDAQGATATATAPPSKKARTEERRSIFVRSLPATATSEKLTEFFSEHFPVKHAIVVTDPKTKVSRGYGFVTFTDAEDAAQAKAKLDNELLDGRRLRLDIAEPRSRPTATNRSAKVLDGAAAAAEKKKKREEELAEARKAPKLIVRNLPWSVKTSEDLSDLFRMYGKVKFADLPSNKGKLSGFGFVTLRGKKNSENAIEGVNGKVIDGRTLAVDWAVDKQKWHELQAQDEEAAKQEPADKAKASKTRTSKADGPPKTAEQEQADEDLRNFMANNMENLEDEDDENEDDDDDDDKDEDGEEGEEEEDEEEKDWEDDEDEKEAKEEAKPKKVLQTDNSTTVFVRNLPFTTTDAELKTHFSKFGPVRYARIVMDRATDRPAGTGFVCFVSEEASQACVRGAPRPQTTSAVGKHSVLQDERVDGDGRYTLGGRVLQVAQAVSKTEATQLAAAGPAAQRARDKDKRRLFLLTEGTVAVGSALYDALPPAEVQMREASAKQRQAMVKGNPSLHLSLTRLAVRNIPRHIDSKGLKELARKAVVGFATDVKQGVRAPLSKEELARGGQQDREAEHLRRAKGKGVVKQAKVVFETDRGSKVDEASEGGKSRGYGFIEYWSHRWALTGLRWLNGHALKSKDGKKTQRLIVEFAIENVNVVARRKANEEKSRRPRPSRGEAEAEGGAGGDNRGAGQRAPFRGTNGAFGKGDRRGGGKRGGGSGGKAGGETAKTGSGSKVKAGAGAEEAAAKPSKKAKADAKLALRQQIIQRKRMVRKKKSQARRG